MSPEQEMEEGTNQSFKHLGLRQELLDAVERLGWSSPTPIQSKAIPVVLQGKDVIGLAQTGSGKTAAFALPILQDLLEKRSRFFALVLSPTRELALQIHEQFQALGSGFGLTSAALVGGIDMVGQAIALAKRPHVIVGSPGRVVDHLANTKGFDLRALKHLVLDEADKLLDLDFEKEIDQILKVLPRERQTQLFSATMTSKVNKLQRACLRDPVKVEVSLKYQTVDTLRQQMLFVPARDKEAYLTALLNDLAGASTIVFTATCDNTLRLALMLRNLTFQAVPIHGNLTQERRLGALNKFKSGDARILVATNVACRGLDIPQVDLVVNYDVPGNSKDYVHRVGRTARAGRTGRAVTIVTQYDVETYLKIEKALGQKLDALQQDKDAVMLLKERVSEALSLAAGSMRQAEERKKERKRKNAAGSKAPKVARTRVA